MSEQLVSAIKDLIARAGPEPLPVIALTDEEVAALDGDFSGQGPVPLPWLAARDEPARELACQVALRGLAARRLIVPLGADGGREVVALHDDLRAVLGMRRTAHGVVCALRQPDGRMLLVYLGTSGALEETISPGGLHGFTVVSHAAAAERLADFAAPGSAGAVPPQAEGEMRPAVVSLADIAQGAELPGTSGARSVTMVTRLVFGSTAGEQRLTVYAQEAGMVVACPADAHGEPGLRFTPVSRPGLRERLADLLSARELVAEFQDRP